ncbi:glycosyltransferase family 4 protein [Oceanotoga teriensis]|uniref:glycosyltransferase family 4 protein n=1 Tax=Oceanotoga teriensis TaxID=515440 RepID=UPI0027127593|nr:glycosyltransferase family 4 protein [Oceanotoga teriensis]MDO7975862.1 glycosyltransferase family 4 protein [Oceanotoga teriensis]
MKNKKSIKVITQMFYPDIAATAKVLTDIFFYLSDDYNINVVCQNRSYVDSDVIFDDFYKYKNLKIKRIKVKKTNKNKIFDRLNNFYFLYKKFKKELKNSKEDIFFCVSNPPFIPYLTVKYAKKNKRKSIFLLHDLYPDVLYKLNKIKKKSIVYKILYKLNNYAFNNADCIIVLGRDAKEYIIKNFDVCEKKIKIIPNWAKNNNIDFNFGFNFRKKYNLEKNFLIMYTGNLGETADFDVLLNTAKELKELKDIVFVIIGDGRKKINLKNYIERENLENILLLNYQDEDKYYDILNSSDALLLSLNKNLKGISVPSKTYTYLSIGKPIIAIVPNDSEIGLSIKEDNYGILNNFDSLKLKNDIIELYEDKELYNFYSNNSINTFFKKYDKEIILKKYKNLIKELEDI